MTTKDGPDVILVGIDGSPTSLRAGAYAAGLARRQQARLTVVYVVPAHPVVAGLAPGSLATLEGSEEEAVAEVRAMVDAGVRYHGMEVDFRVGHGDPYTKICRIADEIQTDAVVVGSSTQLGHRFVGSLALKLVRAGRWPVTVVP